MSSAENPFAGQGAVLLDIGDDVGALVVTMPAAMVDTEVEIRPVGAVHHHSPRGSTATTTRTRAGTSPTSRSSARPVVDGTVPSLVFGELTAGRYDLFCKGRPDDVELTVDVEGGAVATAVWPG